MLTWSCFLTWSVLYFEVLILSVLSCFIYLSLSLANETSLSVTNFLGNTVCLPSLISIAAGGKQEVSFCSYEIFSLLFLGVAQKFVQDLMIDDVVLFSVI